MAVQQNKKSPSKRGMHRSHNALNVPGIAVEPTTGETHLRPPVLSAWRPAFAVYQRKKPALHMRSCGLF